MRARTLPSNGEVRIVWYFTVINCNPMCIRGGQWSTCITNVVASGFTVYLVRTGTRLSNDSILFRLRDTILYWARKAILLNDLRNI